MLSAVTELTWAPAESASTELHFGIVPKVFTDTCFTKPSAFLKGCCWSENTTTEKLCKQRLFPGFSVNWKTFTELVFHITYLQNLSFSLKSTEIYLPEISTPRLITTYLQKECNGQRALQKSTSKRQTAVWSTPHHVIVTSYCLLHMSLNMVSLGYFVHFHDVDH